LGFFQGLRGLLGYGRLDDILQGLNEVTNGRRFRLTVPGGEIGGLEAAEAEGWLYLIQQNRNYGYASGFGFVYFFQDPI
jgi:hypothetical protein